MIQKDIVSSQRDNLSETKISRKAHFARVAEVVERCQMCWNLHQMQHICNKDYDMYRTLSEQSGNVLFFLLNRINRIYKLLYIKVCVYFFGQSHSTRVPHNLFDYCLIHTSFR